MGASQFDAVAQLTGNGLSGVERLRKLGDFAHALGWRPSDRLEIPNADGAQAHLLVEHGLQNTAVISFVQRPGRFSDLGDDARRRLLSIAYNNLVDWHIPIESDTVSFVFVRTRVPTVVATERFSRDNYDILRSDAFERVSGRRPNPNIPALDDALIRTVSLWKRQVAAELGDAAQIEDIAAIFNAIIFVRALEDTHVPSRNDTRERLRENWASARSSGNTLRHVIRSTAVQLVNAPPPSYLIDETRLSVFDRLSPETVTSLLGDFYQNRFAPYRYDFSMMSKHALSRIYEHYVSLLRQPPDNYQLELIPSVPVVLPDELITRSTGTVYTPQFLARFFARYLREQVAPFAAKRMCYVDPACGSGIFLRTMLELLCDPLQQDVTPELIDQLFSLAHGVDINENAVQATRLSLALLYLALQGRLPASINATCADALPHFYRDGSQLGTFDAVLANPPFVSHDHQSTETRAAVADVLGKDATGRSDLHLAFLKLSVELLRPGGVGLFVIPHSFLLADTARGMRRFLARECWIRCLVDLSSIQVFDLGVYVVLLIVQKHAGPKRLSAMPAATIVKCQDLVGQALQDVVDGRFGEGPHYSVYSVPQSDFQDARWTVLPPAEALVKERLSGMPLLKTFLRVHEGAVTGKDDVFLRLTRDIPERERGAYLPILQDREMLTYTVPAQTERSMFFPFKDAAKLTESYIKREFPKTWQYLVSHRDELESRKSIIKYNRAWWEPMWPRVDTIQRPKLVVPHLVLVPKFGADIEGKYAVTRGPMLVARESSDETELLKFFLAVLNSTICFWYVSNHSHRYQRGYVMLEPKTLADTPVPDPAAVPARIRRDLLKLVDERLRGVKADAVRLEREIDAKVADLYGIPQSIREQLGFDV